MREDNPQQKTQREEIKMHKAEIALNFSDYEILIKIFRNGKVYT